MSIRKVLAFIVNKVYYFGAFVVICGLICQNLGLESAKKVTIIGLFFEAAIFFFGMFSLEENDDEKKKEVEDDQNKKIYYTDGNGNYYLKNPNIGIQGGVLPVGGGSNIGGVQRLPYNYNYNGDYVNGANESYYMPDINSDIKQLKEKIDFLESLRKKQIHNLTAGGYFNNESSNDLDDDNIFTNTSNDKKDKKDKKKSFKNFEKDVEKDIETEDDIDDEDLNSDSDNNNNNFNNRNKKVRRNKNTDNE